jgi:hypothetical protein
MSENNLLNSFQSAYVKSHSTETTLLSVHDYIIRAMSLQQVTCLCPLDLSAAFDTIGHSILLERLRSWFGFNNTVLSWIKSYLMHRSFYVKLNGTKSSVFQLSYGVPQGSVLGPLLFILYTTPLSIIISKSATNHHLYADDTQLYTSFSATEFCQNISHLENTISLVQNWMSSNILSLNPSKTEFLIISLRQQLAKLSHPTRGYSMGYRTNTPYWTPKKAKLKALGPILSRGVDPPAGGGRNPRTFPPLTAEFFPPPPEPNWTQAASTPPSVDASDTG